MKPSVKPVALALLALAAVVAGLCVTDEVLRAVHVDAAEGCCGLAHCSVVMLTVSAVGLWTAAATVGATVASAARCSTTQPVVPPPELQVLHVA